MTLTPGEVAAMRGTSLQSGARVFWQLADEIAAVYGLPVKALSQHGRGSLQANEARQFLCLYAIRRGISASAIGRWLGRDPSTILHAAKQAEAKEAAVAKAADDVLE